MKPRWAIVAAFAIAQLSHHLFTLRTVPPEGWPPYVDGLPMAAAWPGPNSLEIVWCPTAWAVNLLAAMIWSVPLALALRAAARDAIKQVGLVLLVLAVVATALLDVLPWWLGGHQLSVAPHAERGNGRVTFIPLALPRVREPDSIVTVEATRIVFPDGGIANGWDGWPDEVAPILRVEADAGIALVALAQHRLTRESTKRIRILCSAPSAEVFVRPWPNSYPAPVEQEFILFSAPDGVWVSASPVTAAHPPIAALKQPLAPAEASSVSQAIQRANPGIKVFLVGNELSPLTACELLKLAQPTSDNVIFGNF